ncbi:MAG: hypothetical protein FWE32_01360 [Oscillospiraceae bacterium]|nr:hypothetical protein [Oscillospiraceae bacterium]
MKRVEKRTPPPVSPNDFTNYQPRSCVAITAKQAEVLAEYIRTQEKEHILLYIWRFVFKIDNKIIARYSGCENVNGIVEAFRFSCMRYLELENPISDAGLSKALDLVMGDFEIMLLSSECGICWLSGKKFDYSRTLRQAIAAMEEKRIQELDRALPADTKHTKLNNQQLKRLGNYILDLPEKQGMILHLHYINRVSCEEIEEVMGIQRVRGTIEYLREALSRKLKCPNVVSEESLRKALESVQLLSLC